jgi:hypothetical protein
MVNNVLDKAKGDNVGYRYIASIRNGKSALDIFENGKLEYTLETGTPQDCKAALYESAFDELHVYVNKVPE